MPYVIVPTPDGRFAVHSHNPVELARFRSEGHARLFVEKVLEFGPHSALAVGDAPGAAVAAIEPQEARFDPRLSRGDFRREEVAAIEAQMDALVGPVPDTAPCDAGAEPETLATLGLKLLDGLQPPPDTWEAALTRVAAGEGVKVVADSMGLPWQSLRARWAARKPKHLQEVVEAVERVVAAEVGHHPRPLPEGSLMAELPIEPRRTETMVAPLCQRPVIAGKLPRQVIVLPDEAEDVRGRPDLVARREAVWTDALDMRVIEAADDEAQLWQLASETGFTLERIKRRQTALLEGIARELRA